MSKILDNIFDVVSHRTVNTVACGRSKEPPGLECSFIDDLKERRARQERSGNKSPTSPNDLAQILRQKYKKHGILISYDIKESFELKRVISRSVDDLKQLGFLDDIWFDKDEGEITSSSSFSHRLESAEQCNAAIVFISENYFDCGTSKYEAKIFAQRMHDLASSGSPFRVFLVKFSHPKVPNSNFLNIDVDLTSNELSFASACEKAAAIVGNLSTRLEKYVTFSTKLYQELCDFPQTSLDLDYKKKPGYKWSIQDVQSWLASLGVHERYRVSFEENEIDGFLLESLKECDMLESLGVDSKATRQKILHSFKNSQASESSPDKYWKNRKSRRNNVYFVCDAKDEWIVGFIKSDLNKVGITVEMHSSCGFQRSTARTMADAAHAIFFMTSSSKDSVSVFRELLLAAWLEKPLVTAVFERSCETRMRPALKAIISKQPAINFDKEMYMEGLEVLRYHVSQESRGQARVIMPRQYVEKMKESVKPFDAMFASTSGMGASRFKRVKVFLSYHWDVQTKVIKIKEFLDQQGCETRLDTSRPMAVSLMRAGVHNLRYQRGEKISTLVQEGISSTTIVVLCVTLKYLRCDNFIKDTQLAALYQTSVIPVLLQWSPRPLNEIMSVNNRLNMTSDLIDMSSEQLFRRNLPKLFDLIKKTMKSGVK